MRTFETLLILVNLLSLVLSFKKAVKIERLGIAGVNVSMLLIHCVFEGLRYQMAFSYLFVVVLTVSSFIKTFKQSEAKVPRALRFSVIILSFVLLVFTAFLAYALPVFKLPKPAGSYN